jgi:hypothetical protein
MTILRFSFNVLVRIQGAEWSWSADSSHGTREAPSTEKSSKKSFYTTQTGDSTRKARGRRKWIKYQLIYCEFIPEAVTPLPSTDASDHLVKSETKSSSNRRNQLSIEW